METDRPGGRRLPGGHAVGQPARGGRRAGDADRFDAAAYQRLGELTDRLADGFEALAATRPLQVASAPGLVTLFFADAPVEDFEAAIACDTDAHANFCRALLDRGVYPPPAQFEAWFVSLAHDEASVDRTLAAAAESLQVAL